MLLLVISFKTIKKCYRISYFDISTTVMLLCSDTSNRFSFKASICELINVQDYMLMQIIYVIIIVVITV